MLKRIIIVSIALLYVMCCFPMNSIAFKQETRKAMIEDALSLCPPALKSYLKDNWEVVTDGVYFADRWNNVRIDPFETEKVYNSILDNIHEGNLKDFKTIRAFGILACYLAETIYPGKVFLSGNLIPETVVYEGFNETTDMNNRISYLMETYREPYRGVYDEKVMSVVYNKAVNEIVNTWISLWKNGEQDINPIPGGGITINHSIF